MKTIGYIAYPWVKIDDFDGKYFRRFYKREIFVNRLYSGIAEISRAHAGYVFSIVFLVDRITRSMNGESITSIVRYEAIDEAKKACDERLMAEGVKLINEQHLAML